MTPGRLLAFTTTSSGGGELAIYGRQASLLLFQSAPVKLA
jgi:hypothetical protein